MMGFALSMSAALLVLLVAAVLLPWHLRLEGRTRPPGLRAELHLLAGRAPGIPLKRRKARRDKATKRKKPAEDRPPSRKPSGADRLRRLRRLHGFGPLLSGIVAAFRIKQVDLRGRVGLPDPADTGLVWGQLTPLIYGLDGPMRHIRIAPEFSGACFDLTARGEIAFLPWRLIGAVTRFAWLNRAALLGREGTS